MYKIFQYYIIILSIVLFISDVKADPIDQTVEKIRTLKARLKQNRETALQEIEQKVTTEEESNPLNAPKDQFETNVEYEECLNQFEVVLSRIHTQFGKIHQGYSNT